MEIKKDQIGNFQKKPVQADLSKHCKQLNTELKKAYVSFQNWSGPFRQTPPPFCRKQRSVWKLAEPVLVVRAPIHVFPLEIDPIS